MTDNTVTPSALSIHECGKSLHLVPPASCGAGVRGAVVQGQPLISCTPQIVETPILTLGIDTLVATLRLTVPAEFLSKLERAKKRVQETSQECEEIQFGETKLFTWAIQRQGIKLFPFVLRSGDVTLALSTRPTDSRIWNAQLRIGSVSCNNGIDSLLKTINLWLGHYQIKVEQFQVSRADLFVDIETAIGETGIENQDRHVTRSTTCAPYYEHRKLTGVQIGRSEIVLRIYDKKQEMKTKRSTEKEAHFIGQWGKQPGNVTRVEFQLKRQAIKELVPGATGWENFKAAAPGIFAYLVNWFRHTAEPVGDLRENNNQHLAESSTFWKIVESSVEIWREKFGEIVEVVRDRTKRFLNIGPLVEQAVGCMLSVAAALGKTSGDLFGILAEVDVQVKGRIAQIFGTPEFEKKYDARAALARLSF